LSRWSVNAQICCAVSGFGFCSFHSDDAFCALQPGVDARGFGSFSAVQVCDLSCIHLRALCLSRWHIFLVPTAATSIKEMWFCGSKQKVQSNNLTIKNIFTLFSVWFPEVPWKAKNFKNNKPAAILKLAFVPSIRTSSCNRAGLHSNRTAQLNN